MKDRSPSLRACTDFSLGSSVSHSTVPLSWLSVAPAVGLRLGRRGLRDEKECRNCEVWPNLKIYPGGLEEWRRVVWGGN